jgi:outer membrane protein OmpA-like peptidoglycan-associated protein/tetratricopeptide (TPR) repeat protein
MRSRVKGQGSMHSTRKGLPYLLMAFLLLNVISKGHAQETTCSVSQDKKAQKFFDEAKALFKSRKYEDAKNAIGKAIDADPEFGDAYLLQGEIALKKKDDNLMIESFKKVIEICPEADPGSYFQIGAFYYDTKKWKDAEKYLKKFLEFDRINEVHGSKAELMLLRSNLYAHPVAFNPVPVKDISSPDPEYLPYISPDHELAFFTRRYELQSKGMLTPQSAEKFMIAHLQSNGLYDRGKPMDDPFNRSTSNNEGGATITIDNKHLFFTVNTKGNFDICTSDFVDGKWSEITNLGPNVNDPKQWDSQPSVSSDGKTLYFASARDSVSRIDIYKSTRDESGNWKKAVKLSSKINTNGNDKSPFIHSDSRTLYFSSDSLPGLGGYDIFKCQMDENGNWGKPVNIGYPINTDADEVSFFVSTNGKTGYFASNKLNNGVGGFDIYSFDLYSEAQPDKVYFQKGDMNGKENTEIVNATIEVKDAITKKLTRIDVDSVTGEYAFIVNFKNDLLISVKKEGYAFESNYIHSLDSENLKLQKVDIELKKLEVGGQYTLHDILFSTNSFELNDTIKTVLDEFSDYLMQNKKLQVALHGHTDNVGNPSDNLILSNNRAKAVFDYLATLGIEKSRMSFKGFGETKPIASNTNEEGRAKNRRTVFVVNSK